MIPVVFSNAHLSVFIGHFITPECTDFATVNSMIFISIKEKEKDWGEGVTV